MTLESGRVLDRLAAETPCLGAVFTSYSFDPAFFEEHVLRAVLRLSSDPLEQPARYHAEARRALQETPVVAFVDAGERQPGRRLPYDLLEVADRVFHPKGVLLVYDEFARLMVGSGNLTFGGYSQNTELFFSLDLAYDDPEQAALLRAYDVHLGRIAELSRQRGTQLRDVRAALTRRLKGTGRTAQPTSFVLLDSLTGPIFDQLKAQLPEGAVIERIGMLAPFFERDDGGALDTDSVVGALLSLAPSDVVLDVGVLWDNPQLHAEALHSPPQTLSDEGLGRLWAWTWEEEGERCLEYLTPTSLGAKALSYTDDRGIGRRWPLQDALDSVETRQLWMLPDPIAFAPAQALKRARETGAEVNLWLHPASRLMDDRPVHRPLHAKLLVLSYRIGGEAETLVFAGSANVSRRALLQAAEPGQGNVEVGVAFRLKGARELSRFVPDLVYAPPSALELREHEFPEPGENYALTIEEALHDPRARTLEITWSERARKLPAWRLRYNENELAGSETPPDPDAPLVVVDFDLAATSAEVLLQVGDAEYATPIIVTDLAALPALSQGARFGLEELLMLLGRRIGHERAADLAAIRRKAGAGEVDELSAYFGIGFGPTEVFRAWWGVAEDLGDPNLSVQAFRLRLEGGIGAGAAWNQMLASAREGGPLGAAEVWFFGAELLRTLGDVKLESDADAAAKAAVLERFRQKLRTDLAGLELGAADKAGWLDTIRAFYEQPNHDDAAAGRVPPAASKRAVTE